MYVKGKISTEAASWHPWHMGTHSRPQRPRSFWSAPRIATSGRVQQRKSAIHGLPIKSDWSRIRNECSAHTQKIGSGQSSRSLPQTKRIVGSRDENALTWIWSEKKVQRPRKTQRHYYLSSKQFGKNPRVTSYIF